MQPISRRRFVGATLAATAAGTALARNARANAPSADIRASRVVGQIAPRASTEIDASPFSVGFETLDRRLFDPAATYPHLARLGAKWARVHTGWCRTELRRGEFSFAWLDDVVDRLLKIGIQPWFCVGFGNRLYTPEAQFESAVGWIPTRTPEAREAWTRYCRALADHYRGRARHFEVWNEPQGKSFWRPDEPDPAGYVELVRLTGAAIRERRPDAILIGGAVAGMDTRYFQACMERGLGAHIDKASFHSYRPLPEHSYEADVRQWRAIIAKHRPGIALWHGEVGAASRTGGAGGRADYPWSERRQAKWLLRRFLSDLRMEIELVSYFHTIDLLNYFGSDGPTGKTNYKGLLRGTDRTPKPAYYAYQCLCALFDRDTARAEIPIEFAPAPGSPPVALGEIASAAFARRGTALHAYWHPCGHEVERPDERVAISFPDRADARITDPILIDPLTGLAHELPGIRRRGDAWFLPDGPLADHPLLLADRSIVTGSPPEPIAPASVGRAPAPREICRLGVTILSSADGAPQDAIFHAPSGATPDGDAPAVPLLVLLHTWSGGYSQGMDALPHAAERGWAFIAPDFRGPNDRPQACASDLAVRDALDAVDFARANARIDPDRIYLLGSSGGGHMALMLAARAPKLWAGVSAWVPITDLAAWHAESLARKTRYAAMLEKCCGGPPDPKTQPEYRRRSPLFEIAAFAGRPLDLNAGIHDGHTGSVPVSHSVRAFNALAAACARPERAISDEQIRFLLERREIPPDLAAAREDDPERVRPVLFRSRAGGARLTIFDGGHDSEILAALDWLSRQRAGKPADHAIHTPPRPRRGDAGPVAR